MKKTIVAGLILIVVALIIFATDTGDLRIKGDGRVDQQSFFGAVYEITYSGTNISWDCENGNMQYVVLTNNAQLANPSNLQSAGYTIFVQQDATGSRTLTYGSWFDWGTDGAPTLTTTAGSEDVISMLGRNATNTYCASKLGFTP